ncbi:MULTISPECIES: rhodanese-like domain-containing protein [unclassified Methylocystis]|uniref:rhodanese-like domain-containing protein n=1 Tax=unclassified Methylocystis TaxID=2625913 RepID=UPI001FEF80DD|nr:MULTISPECIES: rhodanese-like domain-containing protein [unclassified Methylocystis]
MAKWLRAGTVIVLDARPEDEFALGHLPGALNVPLRALEARLSQLDPSQEIVAYCRGAFCVLSYEAVAVLRARGFKSRRLEMVFQSGVPPKCQSPCAMNDPAIRPRHLTGPFFLSLSSRGNGCPPLPIALANSLRR